MNDVEQNVTQILRSNDLRFGEVIQSLWSGYRVIQRVTYDRRPAVLKYVDLSELRSNRRGWGNQFSHQRKLKSYQVEKAFYQNFGDQCGDYCRIPKLIRSEYSIEKKKLVLILEDLDHTGFHDRRSTTLNKNELASCLSWLANFHAEFITVVPDGLWEIGTYWQLGTRPDEFERMPEGPLKNHASSIHQKLESTRFKTLVHGDAKLANFCFSPSGTVAAVDFQYVGGGCGIKDIAYFISSCFEENEAAENESVVLDVYFEQLGKRLTQLGKDVDVELLTKEWRELFPFAWADFVRFLTGWSPGHWKLNTYSRKMTSLAIESLSD